MYTPQNCSEISLLQLNDLDSHVPRVTLLLSHTGVIQRAKLDTRSAMKRAERSGDDHALPLVTEERLQSARSASHPDRSFMHCPICFSDRFGIESPFSPSIIIHTKPSLVMLCFLAAAYIAIHKERLTDLYDSCCGWVASLAGALVSAEIGRRV